MTEAFILPAVKPRFHSSSPVWVGLLWALDRWRGPVFAAVGLLLLIGLNGQWRITSDSALYVQQARDLATGGEPTPWLATIGSTPPGLPWLFATVGTNPQGLPGISTALAMLVMAGLVLVLTYRLFLEHADRPTAVLMVVLVAGNRLFYEMSFNLLTELPFAVGLVLLLWGHERRLKRKSDLWLSFAMMAVGVAWMASFRSVAAVMVAGYVLAEIIRVVACKDQRRLGLAIIGVAVAAATVLWFGSSAVREDAAIFWSQLQGKSSGGWWESLRELMVQALPEAVCGQDVPWYLAWPVSLGVVAAGLLLVRVRLLWGVLFGVMLVQWLVFLSDARYVLPILPVLLYGGWRLVVGVLGRWREPWRRIGFGLVVLGVGGANVVGLVDVILEQRSGDFYAAYQRGKYLPVVQMAEVIRRQTPEDAALVVTPRFAAELAVISRRDLAGYGPAGRTRPVFLVGSSEAAIADRLISPRPRLGPPLGRVVDQMSGEAWELRLIER